MPSKQDNQRRLKAVALNLRKGRENLGLTLAAAAAKLDVPASRWQGWEAAKHWPSGYDLVRAAKLLKTTAFKLAGMD